MDKQKYLSTRRKQYIDFTKLYLTELQKGYSIESINYLKGRIDELIKEINSLEMELNTINC